VLVIVGGHSSKVGKTSVIAGLIRETPSFDWTAVKISAHEHGETSLIEETDPGRPGDSARYLAAGAKRSFWLRTAAGGLKDAIPALREILNSSRNAILESNSVLEFLRGDLYLLVLDFAVRDFKESARRFAPRADALVLLNGDYPPPPWVRFVPLDTKPVFRTAPPAYAVTEVVEWLRESTKGCAPRAPR